MRQVDPASVQYRKSIMGKTEVIYDCPRCKKSLRSPLTDAGNQDHCPHCDCEFIVPGEEKRLQAEKAKEEKRLQAEKAKEEERLQAEKAKEEERLRVMKVNNTTQNSTQTNSPITKKPRNSNHYISLGLMYVLSVITKSLWIGALMFVSGIALMIDIGIGIFTSLVCSACIIVLSIEQWNDIFAAREAFRDGSDPDKTTDK